MSIKYSAIGIYAAPSKYAAIIVLIEGQQSMVLLFLLQFSNFFLFKGKYNLNYQLNY